MPSNKSAVELMFDAWLLSLEASAVIWLRGWRMLGGGAVAEREARRMLSEKVEAGATFWPAMLWGGMPRSPEAFGTRALEHYAKPVRANRRRLSRGG